MCSDFGKVVGSRVEFEGPTFHTVMVDIAEGVYTTTLAVHVQRTPTGPVIESVWVHGAKRDGLPFVPIGPGVDDHRLAGVRIADQYSLQVATAVAENS
jgi:hypothetical protein